MLGGAFQASIPRVGGIACDGGNQRRLSSRLPEWPKLGRNGVTKTGPNVAVSCPMLVVMVPANFCRFGANSVELGSKLVEIGPIMADAGPLVVDSKHVLRTLSVDARRIVAEIGTASVEIDRHVGRFRAKLGECGGNRPTLPEIDRIRQVSAPFRPTSPRIRQNSGDVGRG